MDQTVYMISTRVNHDLMVFSIAWGTLIFFNVVCRSIFHKMIDVAPKELTDKFPTESKHVKTSWIFTNSFWNATKFMILVTAVRWSI